MLIAGSPRARYLELLTRCRLALGRDAEAERAADAAEAWAAAVQLPMAAAWADRAAAAVELHAGDPARAAERALASAAAADEVGAPVEAALSRTLAGRALGRAGERDRAATELQRAARGIRDVRRAPLPRRGRARAAQARPPHPPAHARREAPTAPASSR